MLEKNRHYSVTVNKDHESRPQRVIEKPQPFQTPNQQKKDLKPEANATPQPVSFTRGP